MARATLVHHDRGDSKATYEELRLIAVPAPMGTRHVPVQHAELVDALRGGVAAQGFQIRKEEYVVAREGMRMFGVMEIDPTEGSSLLQYPNEMGMAIGIRHANDMSEALRIVTGAVVFVCSNLSMYGQGDGTEFRKLHTKNLDLVPIVGQALEQAFVRYQDFNKLVEQMKDHPLTDNQAKNMIYDMFTSPSRPFPYAEIRDVHKWYFIAPREDESLTDVTPRNAWGLSNAFTRTIREQSVGRQIGSSVKIMKFMARQMEN